MLVRETITSRNILQERFQGTVEIYQDITIHNPNNNEESFCIIFEYIRQNQWWVIWGRYVYL